MIDNNMQYKTSNINYLICHNTFFCIIIIVCIYFYYLNNILFSIFILYCFLSILLTRVKEIYVYNNYFEIREVSLYNTKKYVYNYGDIKYIVYDGSFDPTDYFFMSLIEYLNPNKFNSLIVVQKDEKEIEFNIRKVNLNSKTKKALSLINNNIEDGDKTIY